MIKNKISLLTLVFFSLINNAVAGSTSANFESNATLNSSCVVSTNNIDFGNINPAATGNATLQGNISAICSKGVEYYLYISAGSSNDVRNRAMVGSGGNTDTLKYNVYVTGDHSLIWTDLASQGGGGLGAAGTYGNSNTQNFPIFVKIPLNQYIKPDTYSDSLVVTLMY